MFIIVDVSPSASHRSKCFHIFTSSYGLETTHRSRKTGTCCTNPGMSPDFSSMTEPRKCDVIDKFYVGHLCENPPRDVLHTGCLIKDLSQNVDRGSYTSR